MGFQPPLLRLYRTAADLSGRGVPDTRELQAQKGATGSRGISPRHFMLQAPPNSARIDDEVLIIVRRLCRAAETDPVMLGRCTLAAIEQEMVCSAGIDLKSGTDAGPLKRLIERGDLACFAVREGCGNAFQGGHQYTYRASNLDEVTLYALLRFAETCVDRDNEPRRRGRRPAADPDGRRVYALSTAQFRKIKAMAHRVALHRFRGCGVDSPEIRDARLVRALKAVGIDLFQWDPTAGPGNLGDWGPFLEAVREASTDSLLAQNVGSARTLLDLAATHGILLTTERHGGERLFIPASWSEALPGWIAAAGSPRWVGTGPFSHIMSIVAEVLQHEFADVDPMVLSQEQTKRVLEVAVPRWHTDGTVSKATRTARNRALRDLMRAGILAEAPLAAPVRSPRKNAFSTPQYEALAAAFGSEVRSKKDESALWQAIGTGPLFDPKHPYSIPRIVDHFTITGRERRRRGMRAINSFPREACRRGSGLSGRPWKSATLGMHMEILGVYLGFCVAYHDIDLGVADVRDVFTIELVESFMDVVEEDDWTTHGTLLKFLANLTMYCSPFLEAAALEQGDIELADRWQRLSDLTGGRGAYDPNTATHDGSSYLRELSEDGPAPHERARREAIKIQRAYHEALKCEYAYVGMVRVLEGAVTAVCRNLRVESLAEVASQIRGGRVLAITDLVDLRALVQWNDALSAPMRRRAIRYQTLSMRREVNGILEVTIPKHLMKVQHSDYEIRLGHRAAPGFMFDLWDLYTMGGGVRHQLLGGHMSDLVLPGPTGGLLCAEIISNMPKRVLRLAAAYMRFDAEALIRQPRVAGIHAFRHAAGSYFVGRNEAETARLLLHHTGYDTLLKTYAAPGRDRNAVAARATISTGH